MELWDQRRRRPALGRATPGVQSRPSVVFADGFATAACPPRSLDWTTAPFGAPISIASGRAARGGTSLSSTAASARRSASRPTSAASTRIGFDWACCSSRSRCIRSAPSGSRSSKKRPQQASTRARIFGGLPPGFAALRPRSGAAATCAAASVHPFGAGLPTSCAACGSPQRRQSEVHCAPMGERQLGQHPCTGCCPCSLHTIVRVLWPAPFPQCGPWQGRPAAPAGRVRAHGRTQRRTVLRLLLRRPGQRPNEGAIGGRHRRIWSEMGRDSGVPCE